jgi:AcrR family transcriptional regulator
MPKDSTDTQAAIISAAEKLMSRNGIQNVSLKEIIRFANQKNATAIQYHFQNKFGLLNAIIKKHSRDIDLQRHALLDLLESNEDSTLRDYVAALVRPLANKLEDNNGGKEFLVIISEAINTPNSEFVRKIGQKSEDSINRWRTLVVPYLNPTSISRLHTRFSAIRFTYTELARRAESLKTTSNNKLFVSHLIDLVEAILTTPISKETKKLL